MKTPFINREELEAIVAEFPTPFTCMMRRGFVRRQELSTKLFVEQGL